MQSPFESAAHILSLSDGLDCQYFIGTDLFFRLLRLYRTRTITSSFSTRSISNHAQDRRSGYYITGFQRSIFHLPIWKSMALWWAWRQSFYTHPRVVDRRRSLYQAPDDISGWYAKRSSERVGYGEVDVRDVCGCDQGSFMCYVGIYCTLHYKKLRDR